MKNPYKKGAYQFRYARLSLLPALLLVLSVEANADPGKINLSTTKGIVAETITGTVKDSKGTALPGVTVLLKGTSTGTTTDGDGNFTLQVPEANGTLVFSFIGYTAKEVPINSAGPINVTLEDNAKALEEVVVVGYGTQRKTDVTGALTAISTKEFAQQPVTRVDQVLQGRAAGVQGYASGRRAGRGSPG